MLFGSALVVVLAGIFTGPVGDFLTLFGGGLTLGVFVGAWIGLIVELRGGRVGTRSGWRDALLSPSLGRYERPGALIGASVGLVCAVLDDTALA